MGRIMSLRGTVPLTVGSLSSYGAAGLHQIFEYESPNRKRAWKVKKAVMWIQEALVGSGAADARALLQTALTTDGYFQETKITNATTARRWERAIGPGDNRTIGWGLTDYGNRDNVSADWIMPHGAAPDMGNNLVLDPDRLVTSALYIATFAVIEGATTIGPFEMGYCIELEEMTITPIQSLFQQIKGMGQDTDQPVVQNFP